ncbi:MAG: amidohydrolase family protein [Alphaproteobacteria bacterium]|nr:amidohydrolase family protein [Alphaproteobacteria bacterium]MBT4020308.1 amidohydrolase family protein [Alphaproteobacteria bacterium]MBT5161384.1 amidohydrolase family protein [Alphaproteobacteria bacterium]
MTSTNQAWLDQVAEETLDPDLPICDPHHHLWEFRTERAAHKYLLEDILLDVNSGHNITSTVFIECGAMYRANETDALRVVGETEFVNGIAAMSASGLYGETRIAAGIVGAADLTQEADVGALLDAHVVAGGGRFRGIRHQVNWDASPDVGNGRHAFREHLLLDADFRRGFAELAPRNLSFEAWLYHPQIPELTDLARAFPDTTIILNHFGGPLGIGPYTGQLDADFPGWQQNITELATCPNVVAKLGGINMELNGFGWHEQDRPPTSTVLMEATRRYYEHTIEQFGVARCMFESNFPVDMVSCSYNVLWNSFKRLAADYSAVEKAALFHDTATRVYRLEN